MKIHRAWIMMICATLMIGFSFGLTAMVIAIFLSPIATALNCGMGTVSLHFSFRSIAGLISVPLIVPVFKKCGFRPTLIISTLLGGLTLFAMAHSTSGMMFAVMGVPVTIFTTFTGMQAMFIMLNNWFEKKAGLATAIASCASALATFVFSPILSKHLVNHTWNETMTLMAIIFTVGCLLMAIPMRLTPQEIGLQPYGHEEKGTTASGTSEMLTGLTLTESTKTVPFYILGVVVFAIGFMGAINQQLSAMGYSIGMDAMTVSNAAMFNALGLLIGKPVIGWVRDRFGGFICT